MSDFEIGSPFHQYLESRFEQLEAKIDKQTPRIAALEQWKSRQAGFISGVAALMSISITLLGVAAKWLFAR